MTCAICPNYHDCNRSIRTCNITEMLGIIYHCEDKLQEADLQRKIDILKAITITLDMTYEQRLEAQKRRYEL